MIKFVPILHLVSYFILIALIIACVTKVFIKHGSFSHFNELSTFIWASNIYFLFALNFLRIIKARIKNGKLENADFWQPQVTKTSRLVVFGLIISCMVLSLRMAVG